jgi:PAS domain S-box-containing protein
VNPPFSLLLERLPGMAYRCRSPEGKIEQVTDGCRGLTGYAPEELIDARRVEYRDTVHPDDRPAAERTVSEALAAQRPFELRYRIRTAEGTEKWVWESGCGVYAEDGTLSAIEGLIMDINPQVRAEHGLAQSEARYRRLLESVTDYICAVKVQAGSVVETVHGPGCVAVTGYTSEDYTADPYLWYRMVHEEDRQAVQEHAARALAGETTAHEHRIHQIGRAHV